METLELPPTQNIPEGDYPPDFGRNLRVLNLSDKPLRRTASKIASMFPQLETLHLDRTEITSAELAVILGGCRNLATISIAEGSVDSDALVQVANTLGPKLLDLDVALCTAILDGAVKTIAEKCPNLRRLVLDSCREVGDPGLTELAAHCPRLEYLDLWNCRLITDAGLTKVIMGCPGLTHLDVHCCTELTDRGVALIGSLTQLRHLDLTGCPRVTEASLHALVAGCGATLERLYIHGCIVTEINRTLAVIAQSCPRLRLLDVGCFEHLRDQSVEALVQGCPEMEDLNLDSCPLITDRAASAMGALVVSPEGGAGVRVGWPRLRKLNLTATKITALGIRLLAGGCPALVDLTLCLCAHIDDKALEALGTLGHLKSLRLWNAPVTDAGVIALVSGTSLPAPLVEGALTGGVLTAAASAACEVDATPAAGTPIEGGHRGTPSEAPATPAPDTPVAPAPPGPSPVDSPLQAPPAAPAAVVVVAPSAPAARWQSVGHVSPLEVLVLQQCDRLTEAILGPIVRHCRHLQSITLVHCAAMSKKATLRMAQELLASLPQLNLVRLPDGQSLTIERTGPGAQRPSKLGNAVSSPAVKENLLFRLTTPMRIAFTYDLKADYLARGFSETDAGEFDIDETVDALEAAIKANGHECIRIGDVQSFVEHLARGERWDLVMNICEGVQGIARESQVPILCEAYGIPCTHSDPFTLAICMHKGATKMVVREEGCVATANWGVVSCLDDLVAMGYIPQQEGRHVDLLPAARRAKLPVYPMFAKPVAEGSSKGIGCASRIENVGKLREVCENIWTTFHQPAILEDFLPGREFTVVLAGTGADARVIGIGEMVWVRKDVPHIYGRDMKELENFETVYQNRGLPKEDPIYPAVADCALRSYRSLNIRDIARIDVRCDINGVPNFIEANPLPGCRPGFSDMCIITERLGLTHAQLFGLVIESASKRIGEMRPMPARATPEQLEAARRLIREEQIKHTVHA
ncbi:putative D-alanine--D-alanine ligase [Paratrimastix pyriformis]|uniref:D-alanine--D-alanine ligase n=1 Tax=Paratrimastix pyriformis TaxID=342808 RepID=A0ABQ8U680_9EUKA|nr:putative D-alanine--D-alanine ligase [Paratrimastix pyriformis]